MLVQQGSAAAPAAAGDAAAAGEEAAALAAVRTAFEIELGGRAFYQRAALDCADATLRELFRRYSQ
ncbi:MAG: hypothetical protein U1F67_24610 [Rubrivivax sp.]